MADPSTTCPKCASTNVFPSDGPGIGRDAYVRVHMASGLTPTDGWAMFQLDEVISLGGLLYTIGAADGTMRAVDPTNGRGSRPRHRRTAAETHRTSRRADPCRRLGPPDDLRGGAV
jgi:hypothetical protein